MILVHRSSFLLSPTRSLSYSNYLFLWKHLFDYLKFGFLGLKKCLLGLLPWFLSNSLRDLFSICYRLRLSVILKALFDLLKTKSFHITDSLGQLENFLCFQSPLLADIQNLITKFSLQFILEIKEYFKLEIINYLRYQNFIFVVTFLINDWYQLQLFPYVLVKNYVLS